MKPLLFALSLVLLVGVFAFSGLATHAYAFNNSGGQAQLTASQSYRTVAWHDHYRHRYYYDYYDPYYYGYTYYPYPYSYYYGPGISINTPFFGFNFP